MAIVYQSQPKPRAMRLGPWVRALRLPSRRVSIWAVLILWALVCGTLALVPRWWIHGWAVQTQDRWFADSVNKAGRLGQIWDHFSARVPDFTRGDEPAVQEYLAEECLTIFLIDTEADRVWVPEGGRLRRATAQEAQEPRKWAARARASSQFRWLPDRPLPVAWGGGSVVIAFDHQWCLLKRWRPGSSEVETWLAQNLGRTAGYRFGVLTRADHRLQKASLHHRWDLFDPDYNPSPRTLQVTDLNDAPFRFAENMSAYFGDHCYPCVMMSPGEYRNFLDAYLFRRRMAWLAYGALVGISAVGLSMFLFSQQRERIQADQLASLAHSLKTPLAVLRSRCDTVMNGELTPELRQSQLLLIGNEIAQLTRLIESGLEEARPGTKAPAGDRIDETFFESLDEELTPAFEASGRSLGVYCSIIPFYAPASSLRTALVTLLENALLHGEGAVTLQVSQEAGLVSISIQDEGLGMPKEAAPFLAKSVSGNGPAPAGLPSGRGLGLHMLRRLAGNEGWGLLLENLEPGFKASLSIRA